MPFRDRETYFGRKVGAIVAMVLAVSLLHYGTHATQPLLHDVYRRLYYIPVALGAVWFGLRGGLIVSCIVAALYIPHIAMVWNDMGRELANRLMEVLLYFAFSGVAGYFADLEHKARLRSQDAARNLQRSYEKLRQQADLLVETEEQLRRADRLSVIGQLTAGVAHEIRNPLGAIKGAAEILRDDFPPDHPKAEFLDILRKETLQLDQVVEEFLGLARTRKEVDEKGEADLSGIFRESVALLEAQARPRNISFRLDVSENQRIPGSETHWKQVVLNLLLNAVQASGLGGQVWASVCSEPGKVTGPANREIDGEVLVLCVEDEGPGIAQDSMAKVFDPFYTTKEDGTGLGLAISQRIVMSLGGEISAENRKEGGARFTIQVPTSGIGKE